MSKRRDDEFEDLAIEFIKLTLLATVLAIIGAILFLRWLCQASAWTSTRLAHRFGGGRAPAEKGAAWIAVGWFAFFTILGLATLNPYLAIGGLVLGLVVARLVFAELSSWRASEDLLRQPGTLALGAIQESWWGSPKPYLVTPQQRAAHMTLVGPTGAGKSSAAIQLMLQDAWAGAGMTVIDPKGDLIGPFLTLIGEDRVDDVVVLEPGAERVVGLNPLAGVEPKMWTLAATEMNAAMSALFGESFSKRQAHLLRLCLLGLLSIERSTLLDLHRLLVDDQFRKQVAFRSPNEMVRTTLIDLESTWSRADLQPLIWKTAAVFNTYPEARDLFHQPRPRISVEEIVDSGKILIVNAPTGIVGEEISDFLCTLVAIRVRLACHRRAATDAASRRFHALYIDEASHIESGALTRLITESRSFNLAACLISQSLAYFSRELQLSLATNVFTRLRVFQQENARWLEVGCVTGEEPIVFPHPGALPEPDWARVERIKARSRELYGAPLRLVERLVLAEEEPVPAAITATGEAAPQPRRTRRPRAKGSQRALTIIEGGEPDVVDEE